MTIAEPGLVYDMNDATYHGDPIDGGSLSSTFARLLTEHVPAKAEALRRNRRASKAMNLGKAAHAHALGTGPELIVWQHDGRTKDGKAERAEWADRIADESVVAVTANERDQIDGMALALMRDPVTRGILTKSDAEVSGFWQESGTWCRARYDLLSDGAAWDYKTTQDATRRGFSKAMGSYGYHQQADFYLRGLRALGHDAGRTALRFICQEAADPYLVQIHTPDEEAMALAAELNDRAIRIYAEARAAGHWSGYENTHAEATPLPGYYFYDHEDALPDAWKRTELDLEIT